MRTIVKLVVVAATALVAVAVVSVVSTGEADALPPSTSVLVLAPAGSSVPIPPSTRTPRPPLACSQLLILDAVQALFPADDPDRVQTLGGLVHHCFISGKLFKDPGDLDGQALIIVPIKILVP